MGLENLNLIIAFLAGLTSFFAPCVTVLVPAFLSHMAGVSLSDVNEESTQRKIFLNTLLFIVGFTVVFVLLGASLGFLSQFVRDFQIWISRIGGLVLAGATASLTSGVTLLLAYSVGLMLPFLVVGLFTSRSAAFLSAHPKLINTLSIIGGIILIVLGILVFTNSFAILVSKLYFLSPFRM